MLAHYSLVLLIARFHSVNEEERIKNQSYYFPSLFIKANPQF